MSDTFGRDAYLLVGIICRELGWRPIDFWNATPAEIASILSRENGDAQNALSRGEFDMLMERERNG